LGKGPDYTGGRLACPIWTNFMLAAEEGLPVRDFDVPDGVEFFDISRISGTAGGPYKEAYLKGTRPPAAWTPPVVAVHLPLKTARHPRPPPQPPRSPAFWRRFLVPMTRSACD
jgi:membrane carboxypeptidase/penicillin-binding protein